MVVNYHILLEQEKHSPTGNTGASQIPDRGKAFMCIESGGINFGSEVFASFEGRGIL